MQYKSQFVKAFFKSVYEDVVVEVPTGEIQKSFFGGDKPVMRKELRSKKVACVEGEIDLARLSADIEEICNVFACQGYEVINIATINAAKEKTAISHLTYPIQESGELLIKDKVYADVATSFALNYTDGVIITARKLQ